MQARGTTTVPPGWILRRARPQDAAALGAITVAGWRHAYRGIVPDDRLDALDADVVAEARRETLALPPPAAVFVAEAGGVVRGYCAVGASGEDPATGQLARLYLDPAVIGRGVGSALHDAGVAHLAAAGFDAAMLWVFAANHGAVRFYSRHGWWVDGAPHHPPEWAAAGLLLRRTLRSSWRGSGGSGPLGSVPWT